MLNLADDQLELGQLEAAENNLRRAMDLGREGRDEFCEAVGHRVLGSLLAYQGRHDEAAEELETALASFSEQGFPQAQSVAWAYRVLRALFIGQAKPALEAAQQARDLADVRGYERDIIVAEWLLGAALVALALKDGDEHDAKFVEAETHLTEALTRCHRINLVELEPDILLAWARWHRAKGNAQQAREQADEALAIADRCEYRLAQADGHNFMARLALDEGDRDAARTHAETAGERAWCDGPPHAYQAALDEAERLLAEMGEPA